MYKGIDYGRGTTNIDTKTGIRYGIINMNKLSHWAWDEFSPFYGPPTCPHCGNEAISFNEDDHGEYKQPRHGCCDYACTDCEKAFDASDAYGDEPVEWEYEGDDYLMFADAYGDVWILKSEYYTHAQFCSPCAPGACHLEHPCEDGEKVYCLGADWFEDEVAPYPIYSVKTGELIK